MTAYNPWEDPELRELAIRQLHEDFPPAHQNTFDPETCHDALVAVREIYCDDPESAHALGERILFAALRWKGGMTRVEADKIINAFNQLPRNY